MVKVRVETVNAPKRLVIYGAGGAGRAFLGACRDLGSPVPVAAFCDSDATKRGTSVGGIDVLPPEVLRQFDPGDTRVVIASVAWPEIAGRLDREGWPRDSTAEIPGWRAFGISGADGTAPRCRILTTLPRSGTLWLRQMIESAMGRRSWPAHTGDPEALTGALASDESGDRLLCGHYRQDRDGPLIAARARFPCRTVLLYRQPLDALASQFQYWARIGSLPDAAATPLDNLREWIRRPGVWRSWVLRLAVDWIRSGSVLACRYEDLVADPEGNLDRILEHLEVPRTREDLAWAVRLSKFESLSGGRTPGTVDPASHFRRGQSGEWREVFRQEDLDAARREIGDLVVELGYPPI